MECARMQSRVRMLFKKIFEPGYIMDSYYADSFIVKLSTRTTPDAVKLVSMQLLPELLIEALNDMSNYHDTVKVFLTRILSVVCEQESHFSKIFSKKGDKLLEYLTLIDSPNMNPSLRVAFMEVALSLTKHGSGTTWLLETELWKKIFTLKIDSVTIFVVRLMYKFGSDFLWRINDMCDSTNVNLVIDYLWSPIVKLDFDKLAACTIEDSFEDDLYKTVEPILQILLNVINKKERFRHQSLLMRVILIEYNLVPKVYALYYKIRKDQITLLVNKLLFYMVLLRAIQSKPDSPEVVYTDDDFKELKALFFNTVQHLLHKRNVSMVLDYCYMCNLAWSTICRDQSVEMRNDGRSMKLENQILFISLVPVFVYMNYKRNNGVSSDEDRISEFGAVLFTKACEQTTRLSYDLRDLILKVDTLNVILQSMKRLTCLKGNMTHDQANIVFQALFVVLRGFDPTNDAEGTVALEEDLEEYEQIVLIMTYVMDAVLLLLKNHNISWLESVEVVCLNYVVHSIVTRRTSLSCKFVVTALNVLTLTVQKFLAPNLSLLMESQPGSAMHEIGALIYRKMHDMNWEVRDTALELLHVCADIAHIKYPPMQKQIAQHNLINVALTVAFNDHEPYVQVTAFKCVGAAVKVTSMWEQMRTEHTHLLEDLITVLRYNPEGIVRKEACNVLSEIYQHVKLSPSFKQTLFDHMASTAMSDFHWEVQLSALKFWKVVIHSFLTDQGMLDGTFPTVTFSRETRKIVTLNEPEIKRRLQKALDDLAAVGCLTVLIKLVHDDNEVDVMEAALALSEELYEVLQKYKLTNITGPQEGDPKSVSELLCDIKAEMPETIDSDDFEPESSNKSDNIIEGILKSDDINLLSDLYNKHMSLQKQKPESRVAPKIKLLRTATSYLFVNFVKDNNFKATIQQKRNWKEGIRSVTSLLDDVLGLYEGEVNSLDCY